MAMRKRRRNKLRQFVSAAMVFTLLCSSVQGDCLQVFAEEKEEQEMENPAEEGIKPEDGLLVYLDFDDEETGFSYKGKVVKRWGEDKGEVVDVNVVAESKGKNVLSYDSFDSQSGKSLYLDGIGSNYLKLTEQGENPLLHYNREFTISYWSKVTGPNPNWAFLIKDKDKAVHERDYIGVRDTGNTVVAGRPDVDAENPWTDMLDCSYAELEGQWKMVTVVFSDDQTDLYVNDKHVSRELNKNGNWALDKFLTADSHQDFYLGYASWGAGEYFKGYLDDFAVYNYPMEEEQVLARYQEYLEREKNVTEEEKAKVDAERRAGEDMDALVLPEFTIEDLKLPDQGENGSSITWESSDTNVIANDGTVIRPEAGKEDAVVRLTATVVSSIIDTVRMTKVFTIKVPASAATKPVDREDNSIVYFVDCGDHVVDTVCKGDQFGTHNSLTDQVYGRDAVTNYQWGIVDTVSDPLTNGNPDEEWGGVYTDWTWANEQCSAGEDAASKTETNRYTKNQDRLEVRSLDYAFEIEAGTYRVETYCTNTWNNNNSPRLLINSNNPTADFNEGKGEQIAPGKVVRQTVTMDKNGALKVSFRSSGADNLAIQVAYIQITNVGAEDPEAIVDKDMAQVVFQNTEISDNISLPTEGKYGSSISWETSDSNRCTKDGIVTRPEAGEADASVTLTATFSYDNGVKSAEKTKDYDFTVMAESELINLQAFSLDEVKVTDGYYLAAQTSDIAFLNKFDADRLLSRFRETAGLDTKGKKPYLGWEDSLIGGHCVGHYMTAAAQAVKTTGDEQLKAKLDYMITELKKCQEAYGNGFIFGAEVRDRSNVERQFDLVEGTIQGSGFEAGDNYPDRNKNDTWVPWYTMHKIIQGLVDVYRYAENDEALEVAEALGMWVYNRVSKWTPEQQMWISWTEYGGMNDCMYELYKYSQNKEEKYIEAAHKFDDPALYKDILSGKADPLDGKHANTTIPKFLGALNRYVTLKESGKELSEEDEAYLGYAEGFWDLVVQKHAYITGGTSVMEHFKKDGGLDSIRTQTNCESCCAHNMLRMSKELFKITGKKKYADYYENTLRNAIMGAIDTTNGRTMYFVPMATGYFKMFSKEDPAENMFWCCTGTGMENFTKLGDSIYFHNDDCMTVNQYVASEVTWTDKKVKLIQDSDVTKSEKATFTVELLEGNTAKLNLYFRVPDWIAGDMGITVNTETYPVKISNGYAAVKRTWRNGDKVELTLPMQVQAYGLADDNTVFGFKYGPTVLAAKLGKERMSGENWEVWAGGSLTAPGYKVVGPEEAFIAIGYGQVTRKVLGTETLVIQDEEVSTSEFMQNINQYLKKDKTAAGLSFQLTGTDADNTFDGGLEFVPFNTLNDERYGIYWYFQDQTSGNGEEKLLKEKEEGRFTNSILDSTQPGYQQYENDSIHKMEQSNSVAATIEEGGSTRHVQAGGYFSYNMLVNMEKTNSVLCQFAKEDNGKTIKISVGNYVIAEKTLNYEGDEKFYKEYFEIPADVLQEARFDLDTGNGVTEDAVRVKFESANATDSARLVGGLWMTQNYNNDASIQNLESSTGEVQKVENGYVIKVQEGTESIQMTVSIADSSGLLYVDGKLVNDTKPQKVTLEGTEKTIVLKVYGEDHETNQEYTVTIRMVQGELKPEPDVSDQEAAAAVKRLIEEIGTVNLQSKAKIEAARSAFDALTEEQKKLISADVYKILTDAEAEYKQQKEESEKPPTSGKIAISKAAVSIPAQTYTGKALEPAVTVTYNGKKLIQNIDYTVGNYRNNVNIGTATVDITGIGDFTGTVTKSFAITVKKGKVYTVGNYKYKVTNASADGKGTVTLTGVKSNAAKKKLKKITVGAAVKIGGKSFKVTAVGNSAFSGCAKATSATIGSNVTKIGAKAFYNCKKLTKVTIKSTKLKSVGKNAIKGISKKATVKCPKKQLKKYKKLFKASTGYKKTMKIK